MSNPRKPPSPPPEALRKLAQLQIERLKKEEEEEQWISGEELYTEGSSDEDDAALRAKRRANEGKGANKTIKGTPYKERKHNLKPRLTSDNTDVSSELVPGIPLKESQFQNLTLSEKADDDSKCDKSSAKSPENRGENAGNSYLSDLNEEQSEISWRPKRGSIKLPNLTSEGLVKRRSNIKQDLIGSIEDADKSYQKVMNKIKKLKTYIYDDKAYSPEESSVGDLSDKRTLDEIAQELNALHTEPVDSTKWNNNSNDGTLQSAFAKMNKLDALLRVTETREKEAREETLKLQLEIRRELEKIYSSENENVNVNSSLFKNTAAFYQLCPLVRKKVKEEGGETGENKFPSVLRENVQINLDANNNEAEQADEEKWHEKKDTVPDIHSTDEDAASANEEEDNKKGVKRVKKKLPHFILRNIKLASEGMGTLSITDEEKERLSKLLKDIDNEDQEKKKTDEKGDALKDNDTDEDETEYVGNNEEYGGYTMDPQVEQNLKEIDSKLELLSSNGSLSSDTSHPNINIGHCQENVGNEIQDDSKRGWKEAKLKKRLHEIDSSLLNFTQPVEEPVEPLRETEIQKIIEELSSGHSSSADTESETSFKTPEDVPLPTIPLRERTFDSVATYGSKDSELRNDFTPTPISTVRTTPTPSLSTERSDQDLRWPPHLKSEVVQQLVEQAKALMPYFKFKHNV